jgi:hypothetical protein
VNRIATLVSKCLLYSRNASLIRSRTGSPAGSRRHEKRAQETARHAREPKDCLALRCPDRHRGQRRVLAERRFVIDFAAGRRMVVTDDIETKLAITEVSYHRGRKRSPSNSGQH